MTAERQTMERYLAGGRYRVAEVGEGERGRWAKLLPTNGEPIDGHGAVWIDLQSEADWEFAQVLLSSDGGSSGRAGSRSADAGPGF
jgi:hypothetical protein